VADTSSTPLEELLLQSAGFKALQMEQEAAHALRKRSWEAETGVYFTDPVEQKLRELDVVALRRWYKRKKGGDELDATVYVPIECKSLAGQSLIFGEDTQTTASRLTSWPGWRINEEQWSIVEALEAIHRRWRALESTSGVRHKPAEPVAIARALSDAAFPDEHMLPTDLALYPPDLAVRVSSFQETYPKATGEKERRVVWDAFQKLQSAITGFANDRFANTKHDILGAAETGMFEHEDPLDWAISSYRRDAAMIELFHPVIVVESPMFRIVRGRLDKAPYVRLVQRAAYGEAEFWADIVERSALPAFVRALDEGYNAAMKAAGAKQRRPKKSSGKAASKRH